MGKRNSPSKASDREKKWGKVFNALVKLSQNLQKDRQFLQDRVKSLNRVIYQMRMEKNVESAKAELMLGMKDREAFVYKHRYEQTDNELADFIEWFHYLSQKCPQPKDISDDVSNKRDGSRSGALQDEVRKLKSELEKCKSEKNLEVSALLAEKNFVWNQFTERESNFTEQLRKKRDEVQHANEKVQALVNRAEELQFSNEKLNTSLAKVEFESVQKSEEIFRLSKEIELLKSRLGSSTPLLRSCTTEASHRGRKNSTADGKVPRVKKESDPSQTIGKMSRAKPSAHKSTGAKAPTKQLLRKESGSSKRKLVDETPKLFTSSFKVPKLKSTLSSPQIV